MGNRPADGASPLDWLLFEQRDVISRAQARPFVSDGVLRRRVACGLWQMGHRGIYVAHNGELTSEQRAWIGVLAAGRGRPQAPLAGLTALAAYGLRGYDEPTVHVYLPERLRSFSVPAYVRVHRTVDLRRDDLLFLAPPRTRPERAVIDAAAWARTDDRARAVIAAACQQRLVTGSDLAECAQRMRRLPRRALIMSTIHDVAGGSESISEVQFLDLCRRGRLPLPTRQTVVRDMTGRRRYRDAYFEEWHLHVEIDGGQHLDVQNWWADMQRQNDTWITGDRVLRFPAWAVRNEPQKVINTIRRALMAAGWRPTGG